MMAKHESAADFAEHLYHQPGVTDARVEDDGRIVVDVTAKTAGFRAALNRAKKGGYVAEWDSYDAVQVTLVPEDDYQ